MLLTAFVAARCPADDWTNGSGSMAQPMPPLSATPSGFRQQPIVPSPPVQPSARHAAGLVAGRSARRSFVGLAVESAGAGR